MHRKDQNNVPCFEALEERTLLSASWYPGLVGAPTERTLSAVEVNLDTGADYSNSNPATGGLFRDLIGASNINWGTDRFTGTRTALNFNTGAKTGSSGLTVYDVQPGNVTPTLFTGSVSLSVDLIVKGTKADSPGLVALFNEGVSGKGLALVVTESGGTDTLLLYSVGQKGMASKQQLASVSLSGGIADGAWYRLTMDVTVAGDSFAVTGKVFSHSNPDSVVGAQVGLTLSYSGSLAARGLKGSGQVGMIFGAGATTSKAAFTHLSMASDSVAPQPAPTPAPAPAPEPVRSPSQDPVSGSVIAANVTSLANGLQLLVIGTSGNDIITISAVAGGLSLMTPDVIQSFMGSFANIVVYGFSGNDTIRLTSSLTAASIVYGGDGNDQLFEAGPGAGTVYGDGGDDLLVSVGGGADVIYGGDGFDSFWFDSKDRAGDASAAEAAGKSVHQITSFLQPTTDPSQAVSLEIAGQNIVDPVAGASYASFSSAPLFANGPQYSDIIQGSVGDCYFVASLAGVAYSDPNLIQQMIAPMGDGTYAVRFYRSGQEVYVRVDAELPAYSGNSLYYARLTPQGETWVALTEKAYAQFRYGQNSYASLSGGSRATALYEITSASVQSLSQLGTPDSVGQYIVNNIAAGHAVTAGTSTHAYMVKSAQNVGGQWSVTVYNPWGIESTMTMADFQAQFVHGLAVCLA